MSAHTEAATLREVSKALTAFDTDLADLERLAQEQTKAVAAQVARAEEHETADNARFLQAQLGIAELHSKVDHLENMVNLLHDQLIEGFRGQGVEIIKRDPNEVTPPQRKRGR